jgi:hypothetical protein
MSLPTSLKIENGPIGSALGTWLDFAPAGVATRFLLLWFVILWMLFNVLSHASTGLDSAIFAVYAEGLHPSGGYDLHPPLAALVAAGWFQAFPTTDWTCHLLAMANAALGLYGVDLIARHYLQGDKRIVVLMMLLLTPFYQFYADRFAWGMTQLSLWPIATYCFLRAFETRAIAWSARAGAAAALALLGDYQAIVLLAGFLAGVLVSPGRAAYLRSASPYISAVAGLAILSPHLYWLYATQFASFAHVAAALTGAPLGDVLAKDAFYVAATLGYAAVPLVVCWLAVRPDRATWRAALWPLEPERRMLVVLLLAPLVLPAIIAPFIGLALTPLLTTPGWFLLPIILLRPQSANLTRVAAIRITALVAGLTLCAVIAAPLIAWQRHIAGGTSEGREFYRQIAAQVSDAWHMATGQPLPMVMGDRNLVAATTFYSPDHPDSVPDFDVAAVPWVTPERVRVAGFMAICNADDQNCVDEARRRAANNSNVQFMNFSAVSRYLGRSGKLGRFFFLLVGAETAPRIEVR